jgi:hypothetical protein
MTVTIKDVRGTWRQVADAARTTIKMDAGTKEPSDAWKKKITRAEHSPIRLIEFLIKTEGVKSWITVHNVRHKIGIEHFVSTQRDDRTGVSRDDKPQGALVDYECLVNLQELLTIARKRLCRQAHKETRDFWKIIIDTLLTDEKTRDLLEPVKHLFVPECVARAGNCPEMNWCGFSDSDECIWSVVNYWA